MDLTVGFWTVKDELVVGLVGKLVSKLGNTVNDETEQLSQTTLFPGTLLHPGCFFHSSGSLVHYQRELQ